MPSCSLCLQTTINYVSGMKPAGKHTTATKSTVCIDCDFGQTSVSGESCRDCPSGTKASEQGSSICSECLPGQYQPDERSSLCMNCDDLGTGRTSSKGSTECSWCAENYYWDDFIGCNGLTESQHCCVPCTELVGFGVAPMPTSVLCREEARLSSLEINPGWWRAGPATNQIHKCSTADCRSSGGESTRKNVFGSLRSKDGLIKASDLKEAAGNLTGDELCQGLSHGPLCGVCNKGSYRYVDDGVSTCVECQGGGLGKTASQLPPRSKVLLLIIMLALSLVIARKIHIFRRKKRRKMNSGMKGADEGSGGGKPKDAMVVVGEVETGDTVVTAAAAAAATTTATTAAGEVGVASAVAATERITRIQETIEMITSGYQAFVEILATELDLEVDAEKLTNCLKITIQAYQVSLCIPIDDSGRLVLTPTPPRNIYLFPCFHESRLWGHFRRGSLMWLTQRYISNCAQPWEFLRRLPPRYFFLFQGNAHLINATVYSILVSLPTLSFQWWFTLFASVLTISA
jgi:hypothetical protein